MGARTQIVNQTRGLLMEYGIVLPQHIGQLRRGLPEVLEDESNELTAFSRRLIASLYEELAELDQRIEQLDAELKAVYSATLRRLCDFRPRDFFMQKNIAYWRVNNANFCWNRTRSPPTRPSPVSAVPGNSGTRSKSAIPARWPGHMPRGHHWV